MKKIVYLLITIIALSSCSPLDDIHKEIDALPDAPNVASLDYTLEDADYESLELKFGNFSSVEDAKNMLPSFLASKFSLYGEGSSINVTFKLYAPKYNEKSLEIYQVTSDDYVAQGLRFPNFSNFDQIVAFLDTKYPSAPNRLLVSLTYDYYNGTVNTLNNGFINVNGVWEMVSGITDEEYTAMGEGRAQFSDEDEALFKIPVFLKDKFKYEDKKSGDIEGIMYELYVTDTQDIDNDGSTTDKAVYSFVAYFIFDGTDWSTYSNVINSSIKFGHNGDNWVPDNTIRRTLIDSDYVYIATEFANVSGYEDAAASAERYKNFDRRSDEAAYWSDEMLLNALGKLLDNIDPNADEEQKYILTFAIYDGNSGTEELKLIKRNGVWIVNKD